MKLPKRESTHANVHSCPSLCWLCVYWSLATITYQQCTSKEIVKAKFQRLQEDSTSMMTPYLDIAHTCNKRPNNGFCFCFWQYWMREVIWDCQSTIRPSRSRSLGSNVPKPFPINNLRTPCLSSSYLVHTSILGSRGTPLNLGSLGQSHRGQMCQNHLLS